MTEAWRREGKVRKTESGEHRKHEKMWRNKLSQHSAEKQTHFFSLAVMIRQILSPVIRRKEREKD